MYIYKYIYIQVIKQIYNIYINAMLSSQPSIKFLLLKAITDKPYLFIINNTNVRYSNTLHYTIFQIYLCMKTLR